VDTQTRHALKHNALADSAQSGLDWLQENRNAVLLFTAVLAAVLIVGIGGIISYTNRVQAAQQAFGTAMQTYLTPVADAAAPAPAGVKTYPSIAARAQAAQAQFAQVAHQYGWMDAGKNAAYFLGLTDIQLGQTAQAKSDLESVASSGDKGLAALAQMALASLDAQAGRTADAIAIYQKLAAHPTITVPAGEAKLALAELEEKSNPQQARQIYAELKDKDKDTAAGQIAAQRLAKLN
jgi:tetratricopeptide (TPR) repeat protein